MSAIYAGFKKSSPILIHLISMMDLEVGEGILSTEFHYKDQRRTLDRIVSPFLGNESAILRCQPTISKPATSFGNGSPGLRRGLWANEEKPCGRPNRGNPPIIRSGQ